MVLESPTKTEKNRFEELQKHGLLPSEALRKIETERRLGITPEEPTKKFPLGITKENWWFYASMGGLVIGYVYLRFKPQSSTQTVSLDTGHDYNYDYEYIELYDYY